MRTREVLPGRSPILGSAPGQARLTSKFLPDELPEKKLQLVDMSILSILLSPELGSHNPEQKELFLCFYVIEPHLDGRDSTYR